MSKLIDNIIQGGEYHPTFWLPTPSEQVNKYLNGGGVPSNSFIQVQGKQESSFKSTVSLQMLAEAQRMGLDVGYIDAEIAMDNDWAKGIGVDTDKWYYTQPSSGESAWELCYDMIEDFGCKVVVLDSIDSMQPSVLMENEVGDASIGNHARLHSKGIRKALPILAENDAIIIGINHKKVNITQMGARGYNAGGGKAISFYSKLILELSTGSANSKKGEDIVPLDIFIEKNKLGKSYISIKEKVKQGIGIMPEYNTLKEAMEIGLISKAGGWYKWTPDKETIAQGDDQIIEWVKNNRDKIREALEDANS